MLKEKLLSLGLVINNEYLDKYVQLMETCKDNNLIKTKTQKHHIIPRSYYKENNLELDNTKENIVNLYHYQHILAHWYLYKCAKENYFIYSNACALLYMLRIHKLPKTEDEIITKVINYGEVYTDFCTRQSLRYKGKPNLNCLGKKVSPETLKKLSESHKGIKRSKEALEKQSATLKTLWETRWKSKRENRYSQEVKNKISNSVSKLIYIHKENVTNHVRPEVLNEFLIQGWKMGISDSYRKQKSEQLTKFNKNRVISEETRKKQSVAAKNRDPSTRKGPYQSYKILSNGVINKHAYTKEQEEKLIQQGFVYDTLKQVQKQKDKLDKSINKKLWTEKEDKILQENFTQITIEQLSKLLPNRTFDAIRVRASRLKLTKYYKRFNKCKCVETGKIYDSFAQASRECNINADKISNCCNKKQKTAGGLHWEFVTKEIK